MSLPPDNPEKAPDAYRTISEVAEDLDIPQHVLRFWETRFAQIRPLKRGGGRRYYRPDDVALIKGIRALLYGQGYTIRGVQRILKDQGPKRVQAIGRGEGVGPPAPPPDGGAHVPAPAAGAPADMAAATELAADIAEEADDAAAEAMEEAGEAAPVAPALTAEMRRRLEAALAELAACQRIIAVAREPG